MEFTLSVIGAKRAPRRNDEATLQADIMAELQWTLPKDAIAWHTPNGGSRDPREAANLKRQGVRPGIPDILICWGGRIFGLELKTEAGRISDSQAQTFPLLRDAGMRIEVVRSRGEAMERLREMGIPLRTARNHTLEVRDVFRQETKRRPA